MFLCELIKWKYIHFNLRGLEPQLIKLEFIIYLPKLKVFVRAMFKNIEPICRLFYTGFIFIWIENKMKCDEIQNLDIGT